MGMSSDASGLNHDTKAAVPKRPKWLDLFRFFRPPQPLLHKSIERLQQFCDRWEERSSAPPGVITLAGLCLETLMEFGQREAAWKIGRWLQARQLPDGSLSESRAVEPVFHATAAALRGWLACLPELNQFETPAQKAAQHLRLWVEGEGRVRPPRIRSWNFDVEGLFREPPDLTPLLRAGRRWPDTDWTTAALRGIDYWLNHSHKHFAAETAGAMARRAHLCLEWERRKEAIELAEQLDRLQLPSGAVPEKQGQRLILLTTVGQAALVWFRLSNQNRGDAAFRFMERHLTPQGSLPHSYGSGSNRDQEEDPLATKYFLDAAIWRVRCAYRSQIHRETPLEADDPRLLLARNWASTLPTGAVVGDLGCGTGRYLRFLSSWLPQLKWIGIDFVPEALQRVPKGIKTLEGSLLRIPLPDQTFHAVLVVDTLPDCILPRQAVAEIGRVVKPGGRILIMEQAVKGRLTSASPWSQPISVHELEHQLRPMCEQLTAQQISLAGSAFSRANYVVLSAVKKPRWGEASS